MEEVSYTFTFMEGASFESLAKRETSELLHKWGLRDSMQFAKFRFDHPFMEMNPGGFIQDVFNSHDIRRIFVPIQSNRRAESVRDINYKELRTTQTTMDFFDFLKENAFVDDRGYIKKVIPDYKEDIELCDSIRKAILDEDSEEYIMLEDSHRSEFLFKVFQHICVGGGICQYEDMIQPYLEAVKLLYKDLVTVKKDETDNLQIVSKAYQVFNSNDFVASPNEHPQDFLYFIVDPSNRYLTLWFNKWRSFWG